MFIAVTEVDSQAKDEPYDEADLCYKRQHPDEDTAEDNCQCRYNRNERALEGTRTIRSFFPQHDDSCRNDDEGTQCTDVRQFCNYIDRQKTSDDSCNDADNQGASSRCLIFLMDMAEDSRQQAITRHNEEDTALAEQHDEQYRRQAANSADGNSCSTPVITNLLKCKGNRSSRRLEFEIRNHAGQDSRNDDVQDCADNQGQDNTARQILLRVLYFFSCRRNSIETDLSK